MVLLNALVVLWMLANWLIFDSTPHGNDEFDEDVQLEDLSLVAAGRAR